MGESDTPGLLRATRAGDRRALEELLLQHMPAMQAFVRLRMSAMMRARASCEDLVQSTCAEVLRSLDTFEYRGEQAFRGWLYTAVLNKLRERERELRRHKRDARREVVMEQAAADSDAQVAAAYGRALSPTQALMAKERVAQLEAAFDALPDDYREILTLSRIARMRRAEIADHLGRTEASVRSLLTRALADLAYQLERQRRQEA